MNAEYLAALLKVSAAAISFVEARGDVLRAKDDLDEAYRRWKRIEGEDFVAKGTPEWEAMLAATAGEYRLVKLSKGRQYNADRRLLTAVGQLRGVKP